MIYVSCYWSDVKYIRLKIVLSIPEKMMIAKCGFYLDEILVDIVIFENTYACTWTRKKIKLSLTTSFVVSNLTWPIDDELISIRPSIVYILQSHLHTLNSTLIKSMNIIHMKVLWVDVIQGICHILLI